MPARQTEAIILRTYPLKEADKIVSFFSRDMGKARGVARGARRSKNRFGAALESMSHVRLWCFERETRELLSIDNCELVESFFDLQKDYARGVAVAYLTEVSEQLLPEREPQDAFFRLLLLALGEIRRQGSIWGPVTYFDLWAVRLGGFLPDLGKAPLSDESRSLAAEMLAASLATLPAREWKKSTAQDLRRWLNRLIEAHVERKLITRPMLEGL